MSEQDKTKHKIKYYCKICKSHKDYWAHPLDKCPRKCWILFYGLRDHK